MAVYYSLILFPAASYVIGPQGNTGDLIHWVWNPLKKRLYKCIKKGKEDTPTVKDEESLILKEGGKKRRPSIFVIDEDKQEDDDHDENEEEEYDDEIEEDGEISESERSQGSNGEE